MDKTVAIISVRYLQRNQDCLRWSIFEWDIAISRESYFANINELGIKFTS